MEIYIIRHTSVAVPKGTCYGQYDVDLADTFLDEVIDYQQKLPQSFDAVYSSPLKRCMALAEQIANNVIMDERLQEMNFGNWEMRHWNDIPKEESINWSQNFDVISPPHGETYQEVYDRVFDFYRSLKANHSHDKVLIVTHAGIIRCFWAIILELKLKNAFKIPVHFGEVLVIDSTYDLILQKS